MALLRRGAYMEINLTDQSIFENFLISHIVLIVQKFHTGSKHDYLNMYHKIPKPTLSQIYI